MPLETIYVVRHGYRMNWSVNPSTGEYRTTAPTPTGIPSDPQLASYGVEQANQLAEKIASLDPPVDIVYSSPFYRCLQTIKPAVEKLIGSGKTDGKVRVDNGISEFFGIARFQHPQPAPISTLQEHFTFLSDDHAPAILPSATGETILGLHDRNAYALHRIIQELDDAPSQPRTLLISTHAASMICIGRALTGNMPANINEEDFKCGTCALSKFVRRKNPTSEEKEVDVWNDAEPDKIPSIDWKDGKGIGGGWDCEINGDCSFLKGGEEKTWNFYMELQHPDNITLPDAVPVDRAPLDERQENQRFETKVGEDVGKTQPDLPHQAPAA